MLDECVWTETRVSVRTNPYTRGFDDIIVLHVFISRRQGLNVVVTAIDFSPQACERSPILVSQLHPHQIRSATALIEAHCSV